jgi:3-deoxy-manno-octulosonate cytidylyltransferase (CMP-KDO synthetase)
VVRVARRVRDMELADRVIVATEANEVARIVEQAGCEVTLTSAHHVSGTDRVAEVASRPEQRGFDVIVNVQGDEPFLPRQALAGALARVEQGDDVGTAAAPLDLAELHDPGRVKVVCDLSGRALYFSRSVIPHWRDGGEAPRGLYWQHLGLYAFSRGALERWTALAPTPLEEAERLEQLRALQHGFRIGVALLEEAAPAGIDTPDDLRRAERHWLATQGGRQ